MTAIQESNCKRINTPKLFEHFKVCKENLSMDSEGLKIDRGYVYKQVNNVFEGIDVIDMAIDRCGTLYLAGKVQTDNTQKQQQADNEQINNEQEKELADNKQNLRQNFYKFHANEKILERIGSDEENFSSALQTISAIGVDDDTIYIADYVSKDSGDQTRIDTSRLIALTKNDLQVRWVLSSGPDGRALNKIHTIQCDNQGKTYILEGVEKRILYIDTCDVCYPAFNPKLTSKPEKGVFKPQNLAAGIDGTLYILFVSDEDIGNTVNERKGFVLNETKESVLNETKGYVLKAGSIKNKIPDKIVEPKISDFSPSGITVDIWNQIFTGESKTYTLGESRPDIPLPIRKLSNDADDAWNLLKTYKLTNENRLGSSRKLVSDSKGYLYIINDKNKLVLLEREELNLQNEKGYFEGTYISKPIDSQTSDTHWHRLLLEGKFEKGTQIDFEYFVSNSKDERPQDPGFNKWLNCISKGSAIQGSNKRDALFIKDARGRYLWFKIILSGNEKLSPVVKSVTVFFPKISYLDYLPGIYQEDSVSKRLLDSVSKGLLERFLAIFESIFYEIDFTIDHISRYFDTSGAPDEFLSWLGSWLDVPMDEDWPEDKKRLFIRNAISLYKKRGTRECLEESIELFTGKKPFVVENFHAVKVCKCNISQPCNNGKTIFFPSQEVIFFPPADIRVKDCYENKTSVDEGKEELLIDRLYGKERFSFCVLLPDPDLDETARRRLIRIIDEQKPAHTSYELKVLKPMFYLDMHTYLEVNTVVTEPEFVVGKTSMIGRDTVLYTEEKAGQIERYSRIGVDILLS